MKVRLEIRTAALPVSLHEHDGPAVHIGRDPACEMPLDQTFGSVSWRHARIDVTPDGLLVNDLGSTNGTYVNEQRIVGPTSLHSGDVIRLGQRGPELRLAREAADGDSQNLSAVKRAGRSLESSDVRTMTTRESAEPSDIAAGPLVRQPGPVQPLSDPRPTLMGALSPLFEQQQRQPLLARMFAGGLGRRQLVLIACGVLGLIAAVVLWVLLQT